MHFKIHVPHFGSGDAVVRVEASEYENVLRWWVRQVDETPKDKRRKPFSHSINTKLAPYCTFTTVDERYAYNKDFFRNLLGEEVYKDVLKQAWMMAMPEELKESTPTEKDT